MEPVYLGDGLYAVYDGFQFELRANDAHNPTDTVYLDPKVLQAFIAFTKNIISCTEHGSIVVCKLDLVTKPESPDINILNL
ncbi:MAG TPA: hypothetical protein VI911_10845 [Patescibacteria group bacterium]|nr:hypothetical protein [Patescibacteria group bacterium]